jgi:hypothetical protein
MSSNSKQAQRIEGLVGDSATQLKSERLLRVSFFEHGTMEYWVGDS